MVSVTRLVYFFFAVFEHLKDIFFMAFVSRRSAFLPFIKSWQLLFAESLQCEVDISLSVSEKVFDDLLFLRTVDRVNKYFFCQERSDWESIPLNH